MIELGRFPRATSGALLEMVHHLEAHRQARRAAPVPPRLVVPRDDLVPIEGEGQGLLQSRPFGTGGVGGEDPLASGDGQGVVPEIESPVLKPDGGVADKHGLLRVSIVLELARRVKTSGP
jgi:hypothetical protein